MAHTVNRTRTPRSRGRVLAVAAAGVALTFGGVLGAAQLTSGTPEVSTGDVAALTATSPSGQPSATAVATASVVPTVAPTTGAPSPSATRAKRASRGGTRTVAPKPTKKPTRAAQIVSTGSCGASYYDEGQLTANGETFDPNALTAAHKTLPFNTRVRVVNPANGKSVVVRINDRGPFVDGRCLDLSRAAFAAIALLDLGAIDVRYEVLAPLGG